LYLYACIYFQPKNRWEDDIINDMKAALKFGSEAWVLKKREERLEAAQMKFLRHLLGITKLDKKKPMY